MKNQDKISIRYDNFVYIGDLNFNMLQNEKSKHLHDVCDIFDLTNMIKEPTCFKSEPSLLDVILTIAKINIFYV